MSDATTTATSNFDALAAELEILAKGGAGTGDGGGDGGAAEGGDKLKKALTVTLEDGSVVEAEDGTELIKALTTRLDTTEGVVLKALNSTVTLLKTATAQLKAQGEEIAALKKSIGELGNRGAGRKTVVTLVDRHTPAATQGKENDGISPGEFLAKATDAMRAGRITGVDLASAETYINRGMQVPEEIVRRVLP